MIKGMEILKQTEIMETVYPDFAKGIIVAILVIGIIASIIWACYEEEFGNFLAGFMVTILVTIGAYLAIGIMTKPTPSGKHEYEVIFDDTVDMKDVYARYEIIETRGDIYTLRDKEHVDWHCDFCGEKYGRTDMFCRKCFNQIRNDETLDDLLVPVSFPNFKDMVIDRNNPTCRLYNPKENTVTFSYKITDTSTDEIIFQSCDVAPGEFIDWNVSDTFVEGEHEVSIEVRITSGAEPFGRKETVKITISNPCAVCGANLNGTDKFCPECGAKR